MDINAIYVRVGLGIAAVCVLVGLVVSVVFLASEGPLTSRHDVEGAALPAVAVSPALLARGEHIARTRNCFACHGERLAGKVFADAPSFRVVASNLTPAGAGRRYASPEDWDRAVRHGVLPNGRSMWIMPSYQFAALSDEDVTALYAYLSALEPVENDLPKREMRPLGRALVATGKVKLVRDLMHRTMQVPAAEPGVTPDYGAYLFASTCAACHRADLQGGSHSDGLAVPSLRAAGQWDSATFITTLRTGTTPVGLDLHGESMPWHDYRHLTDDEMHALHAFVRRELAAREHARTPVGEV